MDNLGISVVIVTYNGSERIIPVLEHLANQQEIDFFWEVLLIDNNSNDNTVVKASEFWQTNKQSFKFKIIVEPRKGTMFARQRGINEAQFRYILFCDDDNWLYSLYLKTAYDQIINNPEIAAVGGKGVMEYEESFDPPNWIIPYERNYGTGPQGNTDGDITNTKGCLYSAGAIFDKLWLEKLNQSGFKSSLKGRDGKSLMAGEDTELTFALKLIGGKLFYSSKMEFKHFMPAKRINWEYLKRLWRSFGYSDFVISPYNEAVQTFYYRYYIKNFISASKKLLKLYYKVLTGGNKVGSLTVLQKERQKGELEAMVFAYRKYRKNKNMIKFLNRMKI